MACLAAAVAVLLVAGLVGVATRSDPSADGPPGAPAGTAAAAAGPGVDPVAEVPVPGGTSGLAGRRSAGRGEVADRPWPARVAAPGSWSATLVGQGDRVAITAPGTVAGVTAASVTFGATDPRKEAPATNRLLVLPDGARWHPLGRTRVEGLGTVELSSATAQGTKVAVVAPSLGAVIQGAQGRAVAVGTFVAPDGREAERLALPPGTKVVETCQAPPGQPPCTPGAPPPLSLEVVGGPGLSLRASGDGEVAVAGAARAAALGRTWEGLVAAIEARQLEVAAALDGDRWTLSAKGGAARQVWVDVWPVIDTQLKATSAPRSTSFFDVLKGDTYGVGIQWTNVGFATSQIFEAEGVGPGATTVGFDLNKTLGHDAGLGVSRGDRVVNMRGGGDIDSNLAPGESVDRGLSVDRGAAPTIVLRGNFPEVRVLLARPPG